jgi:hypothetical protein
VVNLNTSNTSNKSNCYKKVQWKNEKLIFVGFIIFFLSIILSILYMPIANFCIIGFVILLIGHVRASHRTRRDKRDIGRSGELDTAHQLAHIGDEYVVYNDIELFTSSGESQQIDHLVIGPNGVFHIETKNYVGEIRFTQNGLTRNVGVSEDPTGQVSRHEYIIKKVLKSNSISCNVTGIINFSHKNCVLQGRSPAFLTVKLDRLLYTIQSYRVEEPLTEEEIKAISGVIKKSSR